MKIEGLFNYIYIILVSGVGFIHYNGVVDVVGFQWLYLNLVNIIFLIYYGFNYKKLNQFNLLKGNYQFIFYLIFFSFSIISIFYSLNQSVAIIAASKIGIILTTLLILSQLKINIDKHLIFISHLFSFFLFLEILSSLYGYFEIIQITDYDYSMSQDYLKGIAGNKNITATSIAFKIPFAYLLFKYYNNLIYKAILIIIITLSFFNLILLDSRAIYVSYIISILFLIISLIIVHNNKSKIRKILNQIVLFILPILLAFTLNKFLNDNEGRNIGSRLNSIISLSSSDVSASTRLRYYEKGLEYFLENPLLGSGIGNWQLISIKLDKENIESYIVPYVAHNDFIEALVEIGIFGGLSYLFFVLSTAYFLVTLFFKLKDEKLREKIIFLSIPFIIYFTDANLNFPHYRPLVQIAFIVYSISVFNLFRYKIKW